MSDRGSDLGIWRGGPGRTRAGDAGAGPEGRDRWAEGGDGTATRFLAGKGRQVGHARYAPDAGTGPSPLTFINARMGDPCGRTRTPGAPSARYRAAVGVEQSVVNRLP